MQALKDLRLKDPQDEKGRRNTVILQKFLWFAGVSRNAVVVVLASVIAYFVHQDKEDPLILTGEFYDDLRLVDNTCLLLHLMVKDDAVEDGSTHGLRLLLVKTAFTWARVSFLNVGLQYVWHF